MVSFFKFGTVSVLALAFAVVATLSTPAAAQSGSRDASKPRPAKVAQKPQKTAKPQKAQATRKARASDKAQPQRSTRQAKAAPRASVKAVARRPAPVVEERLSKGQIFGLHETDDPLDLKSSVALVVDQDTNQVLFSKNSEAVLPIASITKLMTAIVVTEARQPHDELLTITQDDIDTEKGSRSRLAVGTQLTRGEMLHLALMASENRAANALGRHYPGGLPAFVAAMNRKAAALGMRDTHYIEPTGLSPRNQSSAHDLALLVKAAYAHPVIRELSTSLETQVAVGQRQLQFRNTNGLVHNPSWEIGLQKTGYIAEAGRCVVMQAQLAGRKLIMVLLDSAGRYSRIGDAERLRAWLTAHGPSLMPTTTLSNLGSAAVEAVGGATLLPATAATAAPTSLALPR